MAKTEPIGPAAYVREFIEVLKLEIEELRQSRDNRVALHRGRALERKGGGHAYRFETDRPLRCDTGAVYQIIAAGGERIDVELLAAEETRITLAAARRVPLDGALTLFIDRTALAVRLGECFEQTRQNAEDRYAAAARLFQGRFVLHSGVEPDLSAYPRLNEFQRAAVTSACQRDTVIWGPPGTGKTHTIAAAIGEHLKQGRRVLLLSHANTAVDGAMEELAALLEDDPLYAEGHLVRLGACAVERYPLVSIDRIVEAKGEDLRGQIRALETQAQPVRERMAALSRAGELAGEQRRAEAELEAARASAEDRQREIDRCEGEHRRLQEEIARLEGQLREAERRRFRALLRGHSPQAIAERIASRRTELEAAWETVLRLSREREETLAAIDAREAARREALEACEAALAALGLRREELDREQTACANRLGGLEGEIHALEDRLAALRGQVIAEAQVIGATLSMAYLSGELQTQEFDALFVDEVSMAPLLPVFYAIGMVRAHCVFIGDFLQLPPIATSKQETVRYWQERSLFQLAEIDTVPAATGSDFVRPLNTQYRMNPAIAELANRLFYGGLLRHGENTYGNRLDDPWFGESPLALLDSSAAHAWMNKGPGGESRCNLYHATLAATLAARYVEWDEAVTVGVVVPYRAQKQLVARILDERLGEEHPGRGRIEVNTVHSFQGGEQDVILCDTVESEGTAAKWWFFDEGTNRESAQRMLNVAITRAKKKFILLANVDYIRDRFKGVCLKQAIDLIRQGGVELPSGAVDGGFGTADEEAVLPLLEAGRLEELAHFDAGGFWTRFLPDLLAARERVVIFCPFVRRGRIRALLPHLTTLLDRGVEVVVYTRHINEHSKAYENEARALVGDLRRGRLTVRMRREMHEKVILIDDRLVWEGSLNLLSHKSTKEQMLRLTGEALCREVAALLNLEDYARVRPPRDPAMACELCGGALVERQARKTGERFLGCAGFPDCGFTRPCV